MPSWIRCKQLRAIRPNVLEALGLDEFSCTAQGTSVTRLSLKADSEPTRSQRSQGCILLEILNRCRSVLNVDLEWGIGIGLSASTFGIVAPLRGGILTRI